MKLKQLPTPCYIVDEALILHNLEILQGLIKRSNCKVLLAQKAFSCFSLYPLIGKYLNGTTASGLFEARLAYEEMPNGENHVFAPAYKEDELYELVQICDHIVFNSFRQLQLYGHIARQNGCSIGLRLNPEHSTQDQGIYDPCAPYSRLGITLDAFQPELLDGVEGLHFHTLCQQNADALLTTIAALEKKFGHWLHQMRWLNLGGGHHITREDYDITALENCIGHLQQTYNLEIYLEPGEAIALNAGFLRTQVLEIIKNGMEIAILDSSAACHMPDVLEMPYRPPLLNSGLPNEKAYTYRLAGPTCLAGDVIGDYSFDTPLQAGDTLMFGDMAIYSMVKNNTFNGMPLPAIVIKQQDGDYRIQKQFGYEDFKERLS